MKLRRQFRDVERGRARREAERTGARPCPRMQASYAQTHEAIRALVKRAITRAATDAGTSTLWISCGLLSASPTLASSPDWQQSARRLVDILITGSRPIQ